MFGTNNTHFKTLILAAALGLGAVGSVQAQTTTASIPATSSPVAASGDARAPYAWVEFCKRYAAECKVDTREPDRIELTAKTWKLLVATNVKTNRDIEPITDMDHWGVVDRWDMAEDGKGDCEEYVNARSAASSMRAFRAALCSRPLSLMMKTPGMPC
jgi:predicted transglutaminase-like cysteine proteinase